MSPAAAPYPAEATSAAAAAALRMPLLPAEAAPVL